MEDDLADVHARVFAGWSRRSMFGPLSTTDVGVIGLWIAAILTLVTGYDYLRAGLRHRGNGRSGCCDGEAKIGSASRNWFALRPVPMRVFGLAGWSGSGKTTLMVNLLPEIIARGITVSTVKHAHHEFDIDRPGKDSYEHRRAGATEVMISSANRWALMHELRAWGIRPSKCLLTICRPWICC